MPDRAPWFQQLKALGEAQGYLSHAQVNASLPSSMTDPEEIEQIVGLLVLAGIPVVAEETGKFPKRGTDGSGR